MTTASIVAYKTDLAELRTAIKCVLNGGVEKIWIVDNSPSDELKKQLKDISHVEYVYGQGNVGYGRGHNIALRKAIAEGAEYHIVLNSDILFEADVLPKLKAYMDTHKDVGYMIPKAFGAKGEIRPLCRILPTPFDIFARRFLPRNKIKKRLERYELRGTGYNQIINTPNLSGCFMFMRCSVLQQVGLFDDRYFMYFEDLDLIRRIHSVSKTLYYPECTITHKCESEHRSNRKLLLKSMKSAVQYFNKWGWFFDSERREINDRVIKEYVR